MTYARFSRTRHQLRALLLCRDCLINVGRVLICKEIIILELKNIENQGKVNISILFNPFFYRPIGAGLYQTE